MVAVVIVVGNEVSDGLVDGATRFPRLVGHRGSAGTDGKRRSAVGPENERSDGSVSGQVATCWEEEAPREDGFKRCFGIFRRLPIPVRERPIGDLHGEPLGDSGSVSDGSWGALRRQRLVVRVLAADGLGPEHGLRAAEGSDLSVRRWGRVQIGDDQPRCCTVVGRSSGGSIPALLASDVVQRQLGFSSTRT